MTGSIIIINESSSACTVFVSKYSIVTGDDSWFTIEAGQRSSWGRDGWEVVAFKNDDDSDRAGVYVPVNTTVTYRSLHDISTK